MKADMKTQRPAQLQHLQKELRLVLANNPSPMTHWGTNTYLLGTGQVAVIDPGPDDPAHLHAIQRALEPDEIISHIFVTHCHVDHSQGAAALSRVSGAPVYAFGAAQAGRSDIMQRVAATGLAGGGEGVDHSFAPDIILRDGQTIAADNWQITAHWTPGHIGNHMCFAWNRQIFSGDHVMAWASSLVSPPDGDLTDFMASLRKVAALDGHIFYPGHGPQITEPMLRINWLQDHRLGRESQILNLLTQAPANAAALARQIYTDTPNALLPAARRNVLAHLIDLAQSGRLRAAGPISEHAQFHLI